MPRTIWNGVLNADDDDDDDDCNSSIGAGYFLQRFVLTIDRLNFKSAVSVTAAYFNSCLVYTSARIRQLTTTKTRKLS